MNAPFRPEAYPTPRMAAIRELLRHCDECDQLALLSDLIYGTHCPIGSDRFADAMLPVVKAFEAAYDDMAYAAKPERLTPAKRERVSPAIYGSARG